jgi:hypothetical protein
VRQHRHTAWAWLKAEIARQLGQSAADQLWADYARRAHADKRHNDRLDAPADIARLDARLHGGRANAAEQRRLEKRIDRLKALIDAPEESS